MQTCNAKQIQTKKQTNKKLTWNIAQFAFKLEKSKLFFFSLKKDVLSQEWLT